MRVWESVTIVGVGLIGASIGLALRERSLARRVVGVGRRTASLRTAKRRGAVTATTTNLSRGVAEAELIIVCTPVDRIVEHAVQAAADSPSTAVITDAGSTKAAIVRGIRAQLPAASRHRYVGSHPMAGSEKTGPAHARSDLFDGRVAVVTPTRNTKPSTLRAISGFWRSLGASAIQMTPAEHDRAVAAISHLPHVVASALAAATPVDDLTLASTGWLDTTRIAGADPDLWRQILQDNRGDILKSLGKFEKVLAAYRSALERNDSRKLVQLLEAGKERRDALGN